MARKEVMDKAKELTEEVMELVCEYVEKNRARRKFNQGDFCREVGLSVFTFRSQARSERGRMNLNTACILLDAIGYELKIVKKEDKEIVKLMKEKSEMGKKRYYMRKHGRKFEICDSETNMRVKGEPLFLLYEKAVWRLNELNGTENEGFEPLE